MYYWYSSLIMRTIPYKQIETLFLDAGNTIVSMDFRWIADELGKRGVNTTVEALCRAEAAARPVISKKLSQLKSTELAHFFLFYLRTMLDRLPDLNKTRPFVARLHSDEISRCSRRTKGDAAHISANMRRVLPERSTKVLENVPDMDSLVADVASALKNSKTRRLWSMVMPGVPEALKRLNKMGLQLVVVSNADGTVDALFHEIGLRHLFDHVIDSGVVGFEKPDPRIFRHALSKSGAKPETTLHVGDVYDVDVAGAWSAGLHALLLDPFDDWKGVDCERLPDLTALADTLERKGAR
jgi:HAD superfamily hydrolase (TIGR01509 family)